MFQIYIIIMCVYILYILYYMYILYIYYVFVKHILYVYIQNSKFFIEDNKNIVHYITCDENKYIIARVLNALQ